MTLVQIGNHIFNMDQLAHVERQGSRLLLTFAYTGDISTTHIQLDGKAATEAWSYLTDEAEFEGEE